ncbi:MAG: protease HtpX [Phycisphaeraceae bacterium]|nr:MAG: protease HtpX [Phycisphaeraceae bacterium]
MSTKPNAGIIWANNIKTVILLGGMMGLFVAVGSMWGTGGMIMALALGGAMNVVAWFFSDKIAIKAMRAQPVHPDHEIYKMVEELAYIAGIPTPKVYLAPHEAPNAFATGRSPKKAAVCFTHGAVRLLSPDELRGVAAHELAHVKNRDTLTSCIAATIAGVLAFLAQWGFWMTRGSSRDTNPLVMIVVVIVAAVGAALIKAMISRSREFVADADGAAIAGTPDGLINALLKLDAYSKRIPLMQPNPAQNNLFIVEPLASNLRGGSALVNMFSTHPPTEKRIAALRSAR